MNIGAIKQILLDLVKDVWNSRTCEPDSKIDEYELNSQIEHAIARLLIELKLESEIDE